MASVLNVDTIAAKNGTGPVALTKQEAAKARAMFDSVGSGSAVIYDSFNISSITENNTGDDTLTLTNAFSTVNISIAGAAAEKTSTGQTAGRFLGLDADNLSASAPRIFSVSHNNSLLDFQKGSSFLAYGDLA